MVTEISVRSAAGQLRSHVVVRWRSASVGVPRGGLDADAAAPCRNGLAAGAKAAHVAPAAPAPSLSPPAADAAAAEPPQPAKAADSEVTTTSAADAPAAQVRHQLRWHQMSAWSCSAVPVCTERLTVLAFTR